MGLKKMPTKVQIYNIVVALNVAHAYGLTATFMALFFFFFKKTDSRCNGSGCTFTNHQQKMVKTCFAVINICWFCLKKPCSLFGGTMKHAKAINAFTNPGYNSYKRLVPHLLKPLLCLALLSA